MPDVGRGLRLNWLQGPLLRFASSQVELAGLGIGVPRGPGGAALDPLGQGGDLVVGEAPLGGHLDVPLVSNHLEQPARLEGLAIDNGPPFAAAFDSITPIEPEARFLLG